METPNDLWIEVRNPGQRALAGVSYVTGECRVSHRADGMRSNDGEQWFPFESPLSNHDLRELRWYLETYPRWPGGPLRAAALRVEQQLVSWGRLLHERTLAPADAVFRGWLSHPNSRRRVIVHGAGGAGALLALPWELLADASGPLLEAADARIIRTATAEPWRVDRTSGSPELRVLVCVARPEEAGVAALDPRPHSVMGLTTPSSVRVTFLPDGTFQALASALADAEIAGVPFQVVHFDGHGSYDPARGEGKLFFEDPRDVRPGLLRRRAHPVDASEIALLLRKHAVSLLVLEACQGAAEEVGVAASVAGAVLRAGTGSVVAMTHSVMVETAKRFCQGFYDFLSSGHQISSAVRAGQLALRRDPIRGTAGDAHSFSLQDWYIPVLFQHLGADLALVREPRPVESFGEPAQQQSSDTPAVPPHGFVGRVPELIAVSRALQDHRRVLLYGRSGEGKTVLAAEIARWLVGIRGFALTAYVSLARCSGPAGLLRTLARQLGVAGDEVQMVLARQPVLLVVDDVLEPSDDPVSSSAVWATIQRLSAIGETRLLALTRRHPREPAADPGLEGMCRLGLSPLPGADGAELVYRAIIRLGKAPADATPEGLMELAQELCGHPRSLAFSALLVAEHGVAGACRELRNNLSTILDLDSASSHPIIVSLKKAMAELPVESRHRARVLAAAPAAFDPGALAHVLECPPSEAAVLCDQLARIGIALVAEGCVIPDPWLRAALASEIVGSERAGIEKRWVEGMLSLLFRLHGAFREDSSKVATTLALLVPSMVDILERTEAIVDAAGVDSVDDLSSLAAMLEPLCRFVGRPAFSARSRALIARNLPRHRGRNPRHHSVVLSEIARSVEDGETEAARACLEDLRRDVGSSPDAAPLSRYILAAAEATCALALSGPMVALQAIATAERLARELPPGALGGDISNSLIDFQIGRSDAFRALGDLPRARQACDAALAMAERSRNPRNEALCHSRIASLLMLGSQTADAHARYEAARKRLELIPDIAAIGVMAKQMGSVLQDLGQYEEARAYLQEALAIATSVGDRRSKANILNDLAQAWARSGQTEQAVAFCREALAAGPLPREERATILNHLALLQARMGALGEAREAAVESAMLFEQSGPSVKASSVWSVLAQIESLCGNHDQAHEHRRRAVTTYKTYRLGGGEPIDAVPRALAESGRAALGGATPRLGAHPAFAALPPALMERLKRDFADVLRGHCPGDVGEDIPEYYVVVAELELIAEAAAKNAPKARN